MLAGGASRARREIPSISRPHPPSCARSARPRTVSRPTPPAPPSCARSARRERPKRASPRPPIGPGFRGLSPAVSRTGQISRVLYESMTGVSPWTPSFDEVLPVVVQAFQHSQFPLGYTFPMRSFPMPCDASLEKPKCQCIGFATRRNEFSMLPVMSHVCTAASLFSRSIHEALEEQSRLIEVVFDHGIKGSRNLVSRLSQLERKEGILPESQEAWPELRVKSRHLFQDGR